MVSIDDVYQTCLTIINKEQRGYLTPEEFNRLAVLSQREIFEAYFNKKAIADLSPDINDDFSNPMRNISEKIHIFEQNRVLEEQNEDSFFSYPEDFYRLGVVTSTPTGRSYPVIADQVSHKDIAYINLSKFTAPSEGQPVFVRHSGGLQFYPSDDDNAVTQINMTYLRIPTDPVWGFNQEEFDESGDVVYDSEQSTDFELHPSEKQHLVAKILAYTGLIIEQPDISGAGTAIDQKLEQTEQ